MLEGCFSWPDDVKEKYLRKGYWVGLTVFDLLDWAALRNPEGVAIVYQDRHVKYKELLSMTGYLANNLLNVGFRPGDRLIFQLPNIPEMVSLYFACVRIGIIPVACIPAHRYKEISYIAQHTKAKGIALVPEMRGFSFLDMANELKQQITSMHYVLTTNFADKSKNTFSLQEMSSSLTESLNNKTNDIDDLRPDPFDAAIFQLSGGTSGLPKIIPRTHCDYVHNSLMMAKVDGYHQDIRNLITMPIAHNAPLIRQVNGTIITGGTMVLPPDNKPETILKLIEKEKVTHAAFVPTMLITLLNSPELQQTDLSSLDTIISGAAKLNPEVAKHIPKAFGCRLQSCFGMGEGLCLAVPLDDPEEINYYAVGKPISPGDEFKIVDEEGNECSAGEVGELLARGPYTVRGYYNADQQNLHSFTPDGFYRSGDLARLDPYGNLVIEGRVKDTINRGGEKISGEEVENLILAHPAVWDAAVVGMPDEVYGEKVCAFVKLKQQNQGLTLEELRHFLILEGIAKYKIPEKLEIVKELPTTGIGKIAKRLLREKLSQKSQSETSFVKGSAELEG